MTPGSVRHSAITPQLYDTQPKTLNWHLNDTTTNDTHPTDTQTTLEQHDYQTTQNQMTRHDNQYQSGSPGLLSTSAGATPILTAACVSEEMKQKRKEEMMGHTGETDSEADDNGNE